MKSEYYLATLTLCNALIIAIVAVRQCLLSKDRFRLDLFDKCYSVYKATQVFLSKTPRDAKFELSDLFEEVVGFFEVLAVCAFSFEEVRNSVCSESVNTHVKPEFHDFEHFFLDFRVVEVEVRLFFEKPVPVELSGFLIFLPVGFFCVNEDDS